MPDLTRPGEYAEIAFCGALLQEPAYIGQVVDDVQPKDIYDRECQELYRAILKGWGEGQPVDSALVSSILPPSVRPDLPWIAEAHVGSAALAPTYAQQIVSAALRRNLEAAGRQVSRMAKEDDRDVGTVLGEAQARVLEVRAGKKGESLGAILARLQKQSEEAASKPDGMTGVSYGIRQVDNVTGGMQQNDFIVVAARPSVGKSALVKSCMVMPNIMVKDDLGVAVFTAEDSSDAFLLRMISQQAELDYNRIRRGDLNREEWVRYTDACAAIEKRCQGRLLLDDRPRPTPGYIINACRQWTAAGNPLNLVVIDYLQKMGDIGGKGDYEKYSALTYACDDLKKDLGVPIVLVAQLRREAEGRDELRVPVVTDLKNTGALEEAATTVLLLHRERRNSVDATLWVAKNKHGAVGDCALRYTPTTTTFKEA